MNNNLDNMENTELHSTLVYIEEKEFMSDLYPEGLPTNTIIDKTLTAKGATTCELEAKRNSIIVEPNVPVIVGKQNKYPKALGVCEGVTDATIKTYLLDKSIPHKKIIVTPESYSKVKRAADYASINLFKDFFLLIDECEKVVQDAEFRPNIILPFFDFFSFDNKALISATPLLPNLKGFTNHSFTCIKIIPNYDYKKALNLVGTNNVQQEFMNQIFQSGNKIAIFLNSPEYAKALIEKANIRDCTKIYCSDTDGNIGKLRKEGYKAADLFVSGEVLEQYSFFTSRFYSAVDLETSDRPDIIMMTDCISRPHTMIDPYTHAIQIVGRFRNGVSNIVHISNTNKDLPQRSMEEIKLYIHSSEEVYKILTSYYNTATTKEARDAYRSARDSVPYNKYLDKRQNKNWFAIDNYINEEILKGYYHDRESLVNAYKNTGAFNVESTGFSYPLGDTERLKRENRCISLKEKRKVIVSQLELLDNTELDMQFKRDLIESDEFIVKAYDCLGKGEIERLNYSQSKIQEAMILKQYQTRSKGGETVALIKNSFRIGRKYKLDYIKKEIKRIYELMEVPPHKAITSKTIEEFFHTENAWIGKDKARLIIRERV